MMLRKGASTACMLYIISSMAVADISPKDNLFDKTTLSSSGLFDGFDEEVGGTLSKNTTQIVARAHQLRHHPPRRPRPPSGRPPRRPRPDRRPRPNRPPSRPASTTNNRPPDRNSSPCVSHDMYDSIDSDIAAIKDGIANSKKRIHFLGGIIRLAAHDFMDYDRRANSRDRMGPDGCFDPNHSSNGGLETIWCRDCVLRRLYVNKYSRISRADFWIAAANAVIRQTSIDGALDLRDTFSWGRRDRDHCRGSGERLPVASGCDEVEDVFLRNMGLDWGEAVALLGAHTLGRGESEFSGHGGTWVSSDEEAQVFDKQYYEEFFTDAWRPRRMGGRQQDWTTGSGHDRLMLNTDMCLVFDIDENARRRIPCCTRTDSSYPNGQNKCVDMEAARRRCPMYSQHDSRRAATDAVIDMLGGSISGNNNDPFYIAFAKAWRKATVVGIPQNVLRPLQDRC